MLSRLMISQADASTLMPRNNYQYRLIWMNLENINKSCSHRDLK